MSGPHPLFVAARARLEAAIAVREAPEVELDAAALRALSGGPTVASLLGACVQAVGPRGVRQELGL